MKKAKGLTLFMRDKTLYCIVRGNFTSKKKALVKNVKQWDKESRRIIGSGYQIAQQNEYIDRLQWMVKHNSYQDVINFLNGKYDPWFLDYLRRYHYMMAQCLLKGQLNTPSESHLNSVKNVVRLYEDYGFDFKIKGKGSDREFTLGHFYDFCEYMRDVRKLAVSSQKTYIAVLSGIIEYMREKDGIEIKVDLVSPKSFQRPVYTIPREYLLDYINLDIEEESLRAIHLYSIVQIFSCLRIGDVLSLTLDNLDTNQEALFIVNEKSSQWTLAPLPSAVFSKLMKHICLNSGMLTGKLLRTKHYSDRIKLINTGVQECLKRIQGLQSKVDHRFQLPDGSIDTKRIPLYLLLTSHNMRKTGATMYRNNGLSDNILRTMTGHAKNSTLLDTTYTRVENPAKMIRKSWELIGLE